MDARKNAFIVLCQLALKENWCWRMFCSTYGHDYFQYGFLELMADKHPEDIDWIVKEEKRDIMEIKLTLPKEYPIEGQAKLLKIVAGINLVDFISVTGFPQWIGFLELVLYYCSKAEKKDRLLSKAFIPQFNEVFYRIEKRMNISERFLDVLKRNFSKPAHILCLEDLEAIEKLFNIPGVKAIAFLEE